METKYLYLIDHFVPFPDSEYGGIWVVIATNPNECFDLISKEDNNLNENYYKELMQNILKAQKFELKDEYQSGILEAFLT